MNLKHAIILLLKPGDLRRVVSELRLGDAVRMDASTMTRRIAASTAATPEVLLSHFSEGQIRQLARSLNLSVEEGERTSVVDAILATDSTRETKEEEGPRSTAAASVEVTSEGEPKHSSGTYSSTRLIQALPFMESLSTASIESLLLKCGLGRPGSDLLSVYVDDLPDDATVHVFASTLAEMVWETMADQTLVSLIPSIESLAGIKVLSDETSARLFNLLKGHNASDWKRIARLKLRDVLDWPKAGTTTAIHLLSLAIERGLLTLQTPQRPPLSYDPQDDSGRDLARAEWRVLEAMRELLAWTSIEHGVSSLTEAIELARSAPDLPSSVQAAWSELSREMTDLIGSRSRAYEVAPALERVLAELEARQLTILLSRPLAFRNRPTLEELGGRLGLTRERVRQLEAKASIALERALERPENQPLVRAGQRLGARLGTVVRVSDIAELALDADEATDMETVKERLLLWIAGPYELHEDWLVRSPAETLVQESLKRLNASLVDGFLDMDAAAQALDGLGIREEIRIDWLKTLPGLVEQGGHLVRRGRSLADRAETLLRMRNEPMTKEEIATDLVGDFSIRTLGNYLLTDPRFRRRGLNHFGLTEWGGEEYTTIVDEIAEEIDRQGGEASVEYLVETLTKNFGVSENSVRAYASGPKFKRTGRGTIVVRTEPSSPSSGRPIEITRRCYRVDNTWALRVAVTSETLRGSGMPIPTGVASHLALGSGGIVTLSSPFGEVRFTWPSLQPAIGTVRAAAEGLEAEVGDYLFIKLIPPSNADFHLVRRRWLDEASSPEKRLLLEMGLDPQTRSEDVHAAVGLALGLDSPFSAADIERRLALRDEQELSSMLPQTDHPQEDASQSDLDRLTAVLTRITQRGPGPGSDTPGEETRR